MTTLASQKSAQPAASRTPLIFFEHDPNKTFAGFNARLEVDAGKLEGRIIIEHTGGSTTIDAGKVGTGGKVTSAVVLAKNLVYSVRDFLARAPEFGLQVPMGVAIDADYSRFIVVRNEVHSALAWESPNSLPKFISQLNEAMSQASQSNGMNNPTAQPTSLSTASFPAAAAPSKAPALAPEKLTKLESGMIFQSESGTLRSLVVNNDSVTIYEYRSGQPSWQKGESYDSPQLLDYFAGALEERSMRLLPQRMLVVNLQMGSFLLPDDVAKPV